MYFMIWSLNFMTSTKKAIKITTYQETKMFLFCDHTKSHQGSSVASVRMGGVCLLGLSHSLHIDCIETFWWDRLFYLIWFSVPTFFFHFNVVFWLYGNRVINWQSEPLNRLLCNCATAMIYFNFFSFSQ